MWAQNVIMVAVNSILTMHDYVPCACEGVAIVGILHMQLLYSKISRIMKLVLI